MKNYEKKKDKNEKNEIFEVNVDPLDILRIKFPFT